MQKDRLGYLLAEIRKLEEQIVEELHEKEKEYGYKIQKTKVRFADEIRRQHRKLRTKLHRYVLGSRFLVLITTLGGIVLFGFNGLILGPLIAAMFIAAWHILTEQRRQALEAARTAEPPPP